MAAAAIELGLLFYGIVCLFGAAMTALVIAITVCALRGRRHRARHGPAEDAPDWVEYSRGVEQLGSSPGS